MGAGASISARPESSELGRPKLKVTRKVNSIRIKPDAPSPKKKRRPSFFDEQSKSDSDLDLDSFAVESTDGEVISAATREILVHAVEEFLTMNGTDLRRNVIDVVVNSMAPLVLRKGQSVITQGEIGSFVYVIESGNVQVTVNGEQIRTMSSGTLFGELALLFDARRSATVTCLEKCKLWSLNRSAFKVIQRNATNLAIMQRTRRFQVVPELAGLPSEALARLVTSLTPMTYRYGDALYSAGKCSTKIMLIEEGKVQVIVPPALQHLPQEEIERIIGLIRPSSFQYKSNMNSSNCSDNGSENLEGIQSFTIGEGCVLGMGILLGKIGSLSGWLWVDAKVDGKPYVGAMPPVTVLAEGTVKTVFFTVYRFERIFGSTEAFYENYLGVSSGIIEKAKLWPFNSASYVDFDVDRSPFVPETDFALEFFDSIVPIHSIHMGYFALGYKSRQKDAMTPDKYVLKRLFKSVIVMQNSVRHVLDEAKILESLNCPFVLRMLGKFQTPNELIFVFETVPSGDLWTLIHEHDELRDDEGFLHLPILKFYIANIVLALEHMHDRKVAYRNLKPENILMNSNGYIKVAGMAFAKYLSPEMVLNSGHDQGVDKWALGVLLYEMLTGMTPFEVSTSSLLPELGNVSEKVGFSKCKLRRSKSDSRMKERSGYIVDEGEPCVSPSSKRIGSTSSVSCSELLSHKSIKSGTSQKSSLSSTLSTKKGDLGSVTTITVLDALLNSGEESEELSNNSRKDIDRGLITRVDSVTSTGSDGEGSEGEFRIETRTHNAVKSLRGDNASKLLATIAGLKTHGVDLPDDLSDLECSAEIISLILQLLNPDPLERLEIRRDFVSNIFQQGFFFGFNWTGLTEQTLTAPFTPVDNQSAFLNSRFSKKSFGAKFEGDNTVFAGF